MAAIKTFRELQVWQKSHELVLVVYQQTKQFPREELFGLVSQMRRAVASVPANIVEGFRRSSLKDSLHFYTIADASWEEFKYHLLLAHDLKYISQEQYQHTQGLSESVGALLTRWIQSQRQYT